MGVITFDEDIPCSVTPARLFKSYVHDVHNLVPKVLPGRYKSIETLEGNGGPGTINLVNFGAGGQFKYSRHRVDEIDDANHLYKYSMIEGDALGELALDSISYVVKIEEGSDEGSVVKIKISYHTKGDHQNITEDKIKEGKENAKVFFHAIDAHLHAHPHEYNN